MLFATDRIGGTVGLAKEARHTPGLQSNIELYTCDITHVRLRKPPVLLVSDPSWGNQLVQWFREEVAEPTVVMLCRNVGATRVMRKNAKRKFPLRIGNMGCCVLVDDLLKKTAVQVEDETDVGLHY